MRITLDNAALRRVIENYVNGTLARIGSTVSIENVNRKHSGEVFITIAITEPELNQARIATLQPGYIELDQVERVEPTAELKAPVATVAIEELVEEASTVSCNPPELAVSEPTVPIVCTKPAAVFDIDWDLGNDNRDEEDDSDEGTTTGVFPEPQAQERPPVVNVVKPPTDSLFD